MKASQSAKIAIEKHLAEIASKDPLFSENLKKPNKSIDGCMNYIMATAKKKGANMVTDDEVFGWAIHYYDEDSIKDPGNKGVAMDHSGDKAEVINEIQKPSPAKVKKKVVVSNQASLF